MLGEITASRLRYQHAGAVEGWLPEGFLVSAQSGGGSIIDLGAHGYYLSPLLHGAYPASLSATAQSFTGQDVEDHSTVVLSYPNGATSTLETSLVAGPYARWWEVYGTRGFAIIDSRDDVVHVCTGEGEWVAQENGPQRATSCTLSRRRQRGTPRCRQCPRRTAAHASRRRFVRVGRRGRTGGNGGSGRVSRAGSSPHRRRAKGRHGSRRDFCISTVPSHRSYL